MKDREVLILGLNKRLAYWERELKEVEANV